MTVKELIEALGQYDPDMEVSVSGNPPDVMLREQDNGAPYVLLEPEDWE